MMRLMLTMMVGAQLTVAETEQAAANTLTHLLDSSSEDDEDDGYADVAHASPAKIVDKQKRKPPKRKRRLSSKKDVSKTPAPPPCEERRIQRVALDLIDTNNLSYEGEQADRRSAIRWMYRSMGSPEPGEDEEHWKGADGTVAVICNRLGLEMRRASDSVRNTLREIDAGVDVRLRAQPGRIGARKMTPCDIGVAAGCLEAGLGLRYAAWQVGARRY